MRFARIAERDFQTRCPPLACLFALGRDANGAHQLFQSVAVFDYQKLINLDRQSQVNESSVRIYDQGLGLFRGYVGSRAFPEHYNG
jgi:hypothetical protein